MKRIALILLSTVVLMACNKQEAIETSAADTPAPAATTPVDATQTEAVYGDEAPVAIDAQPEADHGHPHEGEGDHAHNDDGSHAAEEEAHEHGEGSPAHEH